MHKLYVFSVKKRKNKEGGFADQKLSACSVQPFPTVFTELCIILYFFSANGTLPDFRFRTYCRALDKAISNIGSAYIVLCRTPINEKFDICSLFDLFQHLIIETGKCIFFFSPCP